MVRHANLLATVFIIGVVLSQGSSRGFMKQPEEATMDPPDSEAGDGAGDDVERQASDEGSEDQDADIAAPNHHSHIQSQEDYVDAPMKAPLDNQADDQEQEVVVENKKTHSTASDDDSDSDQQNSDDGSSSREDAPAPSQDEYVDASMNKQSSMQSSDEEQDAVMDNKMQASASLTEDGGDDNSQDSPDESTDTLAEASLMQSKGEKGTLKHGIHKAAIQHRRFKTRTNAGKATLTHHDANDGDAEKGESNGDVKGKNDERVGEQSGSDEDDDEDEEESEMEDMGW